MLVQFVTMFPINGELSAVNSKKRIKFGQNFEFIFGISTKCALQWVIVLTLEQP